MWFKKTKFSVMRTHTKETQATTTPQMALEFLREGNHRFVNNLKSNRDLLEQVNETRDGQFPFAAILSCIDSRTSAELIFDQGLGEIFSIRIAGNVINDDILGSMEFACKIAGSKLIVVLGHTKCGAIRGACDNVQMGNLSTLLNKIQPSVYYERTTAENQKFGKRRICRKSFAHSGQTKRRKHHRTKHHFARDDRKRRNRFDRRALRCRNRTGRIFGRNADVRRDQTFLSRCERAETNSCLK